ncbi:SDR family oxidoreductase [Mycobacterium koreense]|uniref:Acetoin dehydrogenase n=1 Tax=Mycolicibacillus koreensis TaxID=1069220 RepID=A0A7I7SEC9_9MYCO|nr:SDR family oxidoreductase [Mycolicibacillus koreensis]MCV7248326.1 SDR family oxidoreductase [Mycolicibacillus koreensis]ODR09529.1 acetoin dehydrogenase [Mycolicibacillus koreensis]OSC33746.1 acetoin dehydrogenase [Mycolicibacillus koreensis]BBY55264.1 putative short chain dehydrogenase/reductase [Mycolicibacillus koreensis]
MKNFTDKVAVITGAGSGIGRSLAVKLAERGARLALSDIDTAAVAETAERCERLGAQAVSFGLDVADRPAVYAHSDEVMDRFGQVNLVFNNAGVALGADVIDMEWDDFEWLMGINFWGVTYGTKAFLPHLIASGDGHIVNVSSVFGLMGIPSQSAYNSAKFAVRGFTEALRQEMRAAKYPVGVTCVHPGGIKTNIAVNARGVPADADREQIRKGFDLIAITRADSAARIILRGVEKNKPRVLIGPDARVFDAIPRVIGPRYEDIGAPLYRLGRGVAGRFGIEM